MLDAVDSNRPERRSALITHELSRLDVDIAALSEVRFPGVGSLQEHGAGYTLFWSGKPATEWRLSGVSFMIRTSIASKLENLPTGHSDCIMSMRLPLKNEQYATLFNDKVIILGDFNARVGQDVDAWKGVLGRHGVGNCTDNGRLLLEFCTEQQLVITNTIFQQKDRLKTTWMHPRSKHWHLIDYILVRQKVMPSAECRTDHRLVRCQFRMHLTPKPRKGGPPTKKFDLKKLQSAEVKADFQAGLQSKLEIIDCPEDPSPETLWDQLKTAILQTSEEVLGFTTKRNKDWFDENNQEIQELLTKKRSSHQAHLAQPSCPVKKAAFRLICSNLQRKLREIQNKWTNLAVKTQLCADTGDYRGFYEALKAVYGPTHHVQSPLRSTDGQALFTGKTSILNRWSEHFQVLFSADRVVQDSAVLRIPQKPVIVELDELPSMEEVSKAIEQLKSGKAAGVDRIPPEIWKDGGPTLHSKLHELLVCCWEQSKLPRDLRDAVIITLYKNKGEKSDCSNYRGITLLSIAGKNPRPSASEQIGTHHR
ncbi:uncharacterized protein LOC134789136 [Penaeus indicus]|uniref:uncharacterized protein LOC134789136 n=1 Tax=Penaeus indicus TaxID=29960 RepID=UPI00300D1C5A